MNVWLEVHVDDEVLTRDPGAWPESAALVDKLASAAESEGAQLSFRIRSKFATNDRFGFLAGLVRRGHEVGAHAHGRDLDESVLALRTAGITPTVMAPGLVQVGSAGEARLVAQASRLGASGITDRLEVRRWTYQGWLPRRHPSGLWMLDVSVSPFDWGVLRRAVSGAVSAAYGTLDWLALDRCAAAQRAQVAPESWAPFFGATFHEHDLCLPRSLAAVDPAFDGLRRWAAAWQPRPSANAARGATLDGPGQVEPAPGWSPKRGASPAAALRRRLASRAAAPRAGDNLPPHRVIRNADARVAIVAVHAGDGGLVERLRFLGLADDAFGRDANLYLYARRAAGWAAPGNPSHVADARLVLERALFEGLPVVMLSWSGGGVSAARALLEVAAEAPALAGGVHAWVDIEGPVDRFSLPKPGAEAEWAACAVHDEQAWRGRELVTFFAELARLPRPPAYHRWQGDPDHVHHGCLLHAERAVFAARSAGLATTYTRVSGPLLAHADTWRRAMAAIVTAAAAATSSGGSPPAVAPGAARRRGPAR